MTGKNGERRALITVERERERNDGGFKMRIEHENQKVTESTESYNRFFRRY